MNSLSELKLKPIKIPKFYGDPRKFTELFQLFKNLVYQNHDLSSEQKMYQLKQALTAR